MGHTLVLNADWNPISTLPLSTLNWQDAVRALYVGSVSVIANYDDWNVNSPSCSYQVPAIVVTRQHIKVRRIAAFSSEMIFLRDGYTCQYCGLRFPSGKLTLDHVVPKSHGGRFTTTNLVAACQSCNSRRGNNTRIQPMRQPYKASYHELVSKSRQYPITVAHESWIDYIGWDRELVTVRSPQDLPGQRATEPRSILKPLLVNS